MQMAELVGGVTGTDKITKCNPECPVCVANLHVCKDSNVQTGFIKFIRVLFVNRETLFYHEVKS